MFKINNTNFKKYRIPLLLIMISFGGIFLFNYLTFIPEYSSAESISTYEPPKTLADVKTMQEVTPEICANTKEADMAGNGQYPLIDTRDNQTYTVAKLKDGNCWMTQNIRYSGTDASMIPGINDYYYEPYGGYYNWDNAKAVCNKLTGSTVSWILPTKEQYDNLTGGLSWQVIQQPPYNFKLGGNSMGSSPNYAGKSGYYWSSTELDEDRAYNMELSTGNLVADYDKTHGCSVRCIFSASSASPPSDSISSPNIDVNVPNILTLSTSGPVTAEKTEEGIMVGDFTTTVSSNSGYHISLSATEPNLVNQDKPTYHISPSSNITINNYGWGIKCKSSTYCTNTNYTAITNQLQTFYSATSTALNAQTLFEVGISVDPSLPSGAYSTELTVTASQN